MRVVIVANGPMEAKPIHDDIVRGAETIICADGGANTAIAHGWRPDVVVGDMDSIAPGVLADLEAHGCALKRYPSRKDETDLELALMEAIQRGATDIALLGVIGGRADHTIANLLLLTLPLLSGARVRIIDGDAEIALVRDRLSIHGRIGDTVSLIPIRGDARGVTTEGLEWELNEATLAFGYARGVSNVLTAPTASITIREGLLLTTHAPVRHPWEAEKSR